jgi:hypothetical protein
MQGKNPEEWEQKPNGCASDEGWRQCCRHGWYLKGKCVNPDDKWVSKKTGRYICPHSENKVDIKYFDQRSTK